MGSGRVLEKIPGSDSGLGLVVVLNFTIGSFGVSFYSCFFLGIWCQIFFWGLVPSSQILSFFLLKFIEGIFIRSESDHWLPLSLTD